MVPRDVAPRSGPRVAMLPPRIADGFAKLPVELTDLCRPHTWEDLTRLPGEGMKPIRGVLVHMAGAEAFWIQHVVLGGRRTDARGTRLPQGLSLGSGADCQR